MGKFQYKIADATLGPPEGAEIQLPKKIEGSSVRDAKLVPSTLPYDPEMSGSAVVLWASQRHDGTMLFTYELIDGLVRCAERAAQERGGEWAIGPVRVAVEDVNASLPYSNGKPVKCMRETIFVPIQQRAA